MLLLGHQNSGCYTGAWLHDVFELPDRACLEAGMRER